MEGNAILPSLGVLGPELLKEMELIVKQVQGNLKVAQDRQKSQADLK